ncbi:MAG: hypothetical protein EOP83_23030 [Verrucomicrobiaceae bacterium]|nr:MAG: hypothetical protein EOP83_23030 [Verrucomicrobiaceae bacterium]
MPRLPEIPADDSSGLPPDLNPIIPDALLVVVAKGQLLPGSGGHVGKPGDAAAGYGSAKPLPIWCVLEDRSHPQRRDWARQALDRAFLLAAGRGCESLGLLVDPGKAELMPPDELTALALHAFEIVYGDYGLKDLHFLPADHVALPDGGDLLTAS